MATKTWNPPRGEEFKRQWRIREIMDAMKRALIWLLIGAALGGVSGCDGSPVQRHRPAGRPHSRLGSVIRVATQPQAGAATRERALLRRKAAVEVHLLFSRVTLPAGTRRLSTIIRT